MSNQRYISDTLRQKKKKVKKLRLYILIFILLVIITGIIYSFRIPQVQITETKISGNSFVTTEEIQKKADSILNSNILWVIPVRNIFLFPNNRLESEIKENPAVIEATVKKDFFNKITIQIVEQEKEALYCNSFDRTTCFYINNEGFLYSQVSEYVVPEQEIIVYLENDYKNLKEFIFDKKLYFDMMTFIKSSARYGISIGSVYLKSDTVLEFHTRDGAILLTSRYDEFEKDFNNFIALFDQEVMTKEQLKDIQYIDLRFGNKVFYKNKTN